MKPVAFLAIQSVLLGSCAFVAWSQLDSNNSWLTLFDVALGAGAGIVLTAVFLLVAAYPSQRALSNSCSLFLRVLVGVASGLAAVGLVFFLLSVLDISAGWYVSRPWTLYLIFSGVGAIFAAFWYRRVRSDE